MHICQGFLINLNSDYSWYILFICNAILRSMLVKVFSNRVTIFYFGCQLEICSIRVYCSYFLLILAEIIFLLTS